MDKEQLREYAKVKRRTLNMTIISAILSAKLIKTEEFKNANNIMLFYPLEHEVNLLSLLGDENKKFYLPSIIGNVIECCPYCVGDDLCESKFHTFEPVCEPCSKKEIDMVIVPALAVDKQGYRLGYGRGFYDRFLKDFEGIKVTCIPDELIFESVSPEPHDIKMDLVISSK